MDETRKLDADEIPLPSIAQKDGRSVTLKCRTLEEAYLIWQELEKEDILTILPKQGELQAQFRRDGHVDVRVSAKAYESIASLRSSVEFQYQDLRSEQPLSFFGKFLGFLMGIAILPGIPIFILLQTSNRKNGHARRARDLRLWFF